MDHITAHAAARMALWSAIYTAVLIESLKPENLSSKDILFTPVEQADIALFNFDQEFSQVNDGRDHLKIPMPKALTS